MGFETFALISLVYVAIGVRVVWQIAQQWGSVWDRTITAQDRLLIGQASFFLLVPISVALHELGHAVAVWSFGGSVTDFGFYGFAGYVSYNEAFDATQVTVVAAAGTLVNLALCGLALGFAMLKRPPFRAAINELLVQFTVISVLNALVIYPLLDFSSGLNGDFRQMYTFDAPVASGAMLALHAGSLLFGLWAWRSPAFRSRVARRTGRPMPGAGQGGAPGQLVERRPVNLTFARPTNPFPAGSALAVAADRLRAAGERVAAGWPAAMQVAVAPVTTRAGAPPSGLALLLRWSGGDGVGRQLMAQSPDAATVRLIGQSEHGRAVTGRARTSYLGEPAPIDDEDGLTMRLRLAAEDIERWSAAIAG